MVLRQGDDQGRLLELVQAQLGGGDGRADDRGVHAVLQQRLLHLGREHLAHHLQADPGQSVPGDPDDLRHEPVRRGAGDSHAQDARGAATYFRDVDRGGVDVREDLRRPLDQQASGRGEVDAAGGALEEPGAQLRLELLDLLGQRGLRHVEALGGAAEVALLRDREEVAQVPQFHRTSPSSLSAPL